MQHRVISVWNSRRDIVLRLRAHSGVLAGVEDFPHGLTDCEHASRGQRHVADSRVGLFDSGPSEIPTIEIAVAVSMKYIR